MPSRTFLSMVVTGKFSMAIRATETWFHEGALPESGSLESAYPTSRLVGSGGPESKVALVEFFVLHLAFLFPTIIHYPRQPRIDPFLTRGVFQERIFMILSMTRCCCSPSRPIQSGNRTKRCE